ncbi:Tex family protein [Periweissella fabalis]|uniref:RNA-binding transcriptional accessory protein n=1 Tax=Periweissella fabalis TaxID=1070421 RepID=A0A7X6N170_9LACO|nr:Tex family protein [Periweissella fabalis]MCM0599616.1 RNA-binding transcriptional accessory protein [Periweissella fabalis]NKZ23921.1 RNA-binding transcriptional accessory protein [Periweissella fabalis]
MDTEINAQVAQQLNLKLSQVNNVLTMLSEGNTVPFIARYRKERTQNLDEVAIRDIENIAKTLNDLNMRKTAILKAITEQGALTPTLDKAIKTARTMQAVEDLYLPYKQKRRTKAMIAKEQGLEPFAQWLLKLSDEDVSIVAQKYLNTQLPTIQDVLAGAIEIIAEQVSENAHHRDWIRNLTWKQGRLESTLKSGGEDLDGKGVYQQYYAFGAPLKALNGYQILALNRGEREKILKVAVVINTDDILNRLRFKEIGTIRNEAGQIVDNAIQEAYKRFIGPAIEREIRTSLTNDASQQAIDVFGENLYHLLMQTPIKGQVVMGFDPGFRTGCKLAVIDANGKFLAKTVIYPHKPANAKERAAAGENFKQLIADNNVKLIAIGNGTASRESEEFVATNIPKGVHYVIVNEAGASVYSASEEARQEFPEFHVEERSAVSIGRRLQDPLAELIKIDAKAIGVGQYQHDLPTKELDMAVGTVIETAVNQIGVNLNTASAALLTHISGLNKTIAQNIVTYRDENGEFNLRSKLKKVPRLGAKAYEQAAGFLRIIEGKNLFDNTDIHPESYPLAKAILAAANLTVADINTPTIQKLTTIDTKQLANQLAAGEQTVADVIASLLKPGRDVRDDLPGVILRSDVLHIEDLKPGMELEGTVRNVTDFGAFIDLGVKHDGLVHISRMSRQRIKHPSALLAVGDVVKVWVVDIDLKRDRIGLSLLPLEVVDD